MTRVYYKEAVGAFIVFDVTRVSTFEAVNKWKNDLDSKVHLPDGSAIPCVLLANKVRRAGGGAPREVGDGNPACGWRGCAGATPSFGARGLLCSGGGCPSLGSPCLMCEGSPNLDVGGGALGAGNAWCEREPGPLCHPGSHTPGSHQVRTRLVHTRFAHAWFTPRSHMPGSHQVRTCLVHTRFAHAWFTPGSHTPGSHHIR